MLKKAPRFAIDNQELTAADLRTLQDDQLLNDKVINVYISLLRRRIERDAPSAGPSIFIAPTHLSAKLTQTGADGACGAARASRDWFSRQRLLLDYNWIFIPVHEKEKEHWTLMLLLNLGEWLLQHTPAGLRDLAVRRLRRRKRCTPPLIVTLDSLAALDAGPPDPAVYKKAAKFAVHRWCKEVQDLARVEGAAWPSATGAWSAEMVAAYFEGKTDALVSQLRADVPLLQAVVPQQDNGSDCGVYMLHYLDILASKGVAEVIECRPRFWFKKGLGEAWFPSSDAGEKKRAYLLRLFKRLRDTQAAAAAAAATTATDEGAAAAAAADDDAAAEAPPPAVTPEAAAVACFLERGVQPEVRGRVSALTSQLSLKVCRAMLCWDEAAHDAAAAQARERAWRGALGSDGASSANGDDLSSHVADADDDDDAAADNGCGEDLCTLSSQSADDAAAKTVSDSAALTTASSSEVFVYEVLDEDTDRPAGAGAAAAAAAAATATGAAGGASPAAQRAPSPPPPSPANPQEINKFKELLGWGRAQQQPPPKKAQGGKKAAQAGEEAETDLLPAGSGKKKKKQQKQNQKAAAESNDGGSDSDASTASAASAASASSGAAPAPAKKAAKKPAAKKGGTGTKRKAAGGTVGDAADAAAGAPPGIVSAASVPDKKEKEKEKGAGGAKRRRVVGDEGGGRGAPPGGGILRSLQQASSSNAGTSPAGGSKSKAKPGVAKK